MSDIDNDIENPIGNPQMAPPKWQPVTAALIKFVFFYLLYRV